MNNKGVNQEFIDDVTQRIYKIQEYTKGTGEDVTHLLFQNLTNLELSHHKEENEQFGSIIESPDAAQIQEIGYTKSPIDDSLLSVSLDSTDFHQSPVDTAKSIKKQTKEMYKAINEKLSAFRNASQNLADFANVDSAKISILFSELDNMKKTIFELIEDSSVSKKCQSRILYPEFDESPIPDYRRENYDLAHIIDRINDLQKEMHEISAQLVCSEKEIEYKEEENLMLKTQLKSLENVAQSYIKLEDVKPTLKKTNCVCAVF